MLLPVVKNNLLFWLLKFNENYACYKVIKAYTLLDQINILTHRYIHLICIRNRDRNQLAYKFDRQSKLFLVRYKVQSVQLVYVRNLNFIFGCFKSFQKLNY